MTSKENMELFMSLVQETQRVIVKIKKKFLIGKFFLIIIIIDCSEVFTASDISAVAGLLRH